jgi:2-keto-3-deoxy-L-rhamnonate aldolase RhmA
MPGIAIGCWLDLPSPEVAEIVAAAGFDFALIDLEHGAIGIETAQHMLMAFNGSVTEPLLRVPEASEAWVKRALDAGAAAVMVPRVEDPVLAARLGAWATYGPEGRRGEGLGLVRAGGWGRKAGAYRTRRKAAGGGIIAQIESPAGLALAAEIAAAPGIGELFFGPADYAASLGTTTCDPAVATAAQTVAHAAAKAGKRSGSFVFPGSTFASLAAMGHHRAARASDVGLLVRALDTDLAAARQETSDAQG